MAKHTATLDVFGDELKVESTMKTKHLTAEKIETMFPGVRVSKTDNANARAIGKLPKWTVRHAAGQFGFTRFDTLAEVVEYFSTRNR